MEKDINDKIDDLLFDDNTLENSKQLDHSQNLKITNKNENPSHINENKTDTISSKETVKVFQDELVYKNKMQSEESTNKNFIQNKVLITPQSDKTQQNESKDITDKTINISISNKENKEFIKPIENKVEKTPKYKEKMSTPQKIGCFFIAFFLPIIGIIINKFALFKNKEKVILISIIASILSILLQLLLPLIVLIGLISNYPPYYDYSVDNEIVYSEQLENKIENLLDSDKQIDWSSFSNDEIMALQKYPASYKSFWENYYKEYDWVTIEFIKNGDAEYMLEYSWDVDGNLSYTTFEGVNSQGRHVFDMSENGNEFIYDKAKDKFTEKPFNSRTLNKEESNLNINID